MKKFPSGCWGPLMIGLGVVLLGVSFVLGTATAMLRPGGLLETNGQGKADVGVWGYTLATGAFLLVGGALLLLVQGLLWLVHKAMNR